MGADSARQPLQRPSGARAIAQEAFRFLLAQPHGERANRRRRTAPSLALGIDQEVGERLPHQQRLLARLDRAEAGHQPRLRRESGKQSLAEAVDRLDAQPPARRVEHLGEQRAGARDALRRRLLAQRDQVLRQHRLRRTHPRREPLADARRHLRRTRLGEGEAQDRPRFHPAQQQAENARGEHLRLPRAGRGGKPDMAVRPARGALLTAQRWQGDERVSGHGRTIRRVASTGRNRRKARIRDGAWRRTVRPR